MTSTKVTETVRSMLLLPPPPPFNDCSQLARPVAPAARVSIATRLPLARKPSSLTYLRLVIKLQSARPPEREFALKTSTTTSRRTTWK